MQLSINKQCDCPYLVIHLSINKKKFEMKKNITQIKYKKVNPIQIIDK